MAAATVKVTLGQLARTAESSPGYTVTAIGNNGARFEMGNFRYDRTENGRRRKHVVLCDYIGRTGIFCSDDTIQIED